MSIREVAATKEHNKWVLELKTLTDRRPYGYTLEEEGNTKN